MPSWYSSPLAPEMPYVLLLYVRTEVHARAVPPCEPWLPGFLLALDEVHGSRKRLVVHRLHALLRQGTRVLDLAARGGLDDAARAELFPEFRVLRIVAVFGLLLRVEVIEVAHELVEAVVGRQVLVAVALVVFAELAGGIAHPLHHGGDGYIGILPAFLGTWKSDLGHAGSHGHVAAKKCGAAGGAGLLAVVIGER